MSVRLGTATLVSQQLSTLLAACPAARIASFNVTWPVLSSLPRPYVHGAVIRIWNHTLISPTTSSCRSTPRISSKTHSAYIPMILYALECLVHISQSEAPVRDCFQAPKRIDTEMPHPVRRLVIMPRAAFESQERGNRFLTELL